MDELSLISVELLIVDFDGAQKPNLNDIPQALINDISRIMVRDAVIGAFRKSRQVIGLFQRQPHMPADSCHRQSVRRYL